jgi:hypothetical protein
MTNYCRAKILLLPMVVAYVLLMSLNSLAGGSMRFGVTAPVVFEAVKSRFNQCDTLQPREDLRKVMIEKVRYVIGRVDSLGEQTNVSATESASLFSSDSLAHFSTAPLRDTLTSRTEMVRRKQRTIVDSLTVPGEPIKHGLTVKLNRILSDSLNNVWRDTVKAVVDVDSIRQLLDKKTLEARPIVGKATGDKFSVTNINLNVNQISSGDMSLDYPSNGSNVDFGVNQSDSSAPSIDASLSDISSKAGDGSSVLNNKAVKLNNEEIMLSDDLQKTELVLQKNDLLPPELKKVEDVKELRVEGQNMMQNIPLDSSTFSKEQILATAEQEVIKLDQVQAASGMVEEGKVFRKKYNDPTSLKEHAFQNAKETAINHFAGQTDKLSEALDRVQKVKSKIPDIEGPVDILKKRQVLKKTIFVQRLVPGFAMQIQKRGSYWLDVNPYIAFKVTGRFIGGLGWNYRMAYDFDRAVIDKQQRAYGLRCMAAFKVKSDFWIKMEAERMRAPIKEVSFNSGSEYVRRGFVKSYFAGLKKDFTLGPRLKGHLETMYNLYDPERQSPYQNKINIRMGFDFPLIKN